MTEILSRRLALARVATRSSFMQHISTTVATADATSIETRSLREGEK